MMVSWHVSRYHKSLLTDSVGSMLNAMQFFPSWEGYFNNPSSDTLGRLSAMYSIGSIASLIFVPILSDRYGRKVPIIVGCIIMIIAACIQVRQESRS